ncbi:uncharacterized protein LOC116247466 [Nymphaea colorata]|uniref:uncharacterized protein LOC116247466 n=1 Tax=Nymphaea colorata TaxID=210225 RepID=UPI00129E097E|nr:uncharacterized protein LOC116247466 [Nymphaea colorata]
MNVVNGSIPNTGGSNSYIEPCDVTVSETLRKMEVLTAFCTMLLFYQVLFGTYRRRYASESLVHRLLWLSSTMSYGVVAFTLGLMNTSRSYHDLLGFWAAYLLVLIGGADTVSAFELDDIEKRKANFLYFCAKSLLAAQIIVNYPLSGKLQMGPWVLCVLAFTRIRELGAAHLNVSRSFGLGKQSKLVADYMRNIEPHLSADAEAEPTSMTGYKYIFYGEKHAAGARIGQPPPLYLITIDQVWQALHGIGDRIRDTCLSFALFKMIKRSLAGFDMAEKDESKTWRLVRDGLLSKEDGERAFRVVEVELEFLFEYFYTKYSLLHSREFICIRIPVSLSVIVSCLLCINWLGNHEPTADHCASYPYGENGINVDVVETRVILGVLAFLEVIQLINLATTNWFKMLLVSIYVKQDSILQSSSDSHIAVRIRMFIQMMCLRLIKIVEAVNHSFRVLSLWRPWTRTLRQYSLLESHRYGRHRSIGGRLLGLLLRGLIDKPRQGLEPAKFVPLCPEIKRAVVGRLRGSWPHLRRGEFSLLQNSDRHELSWACVNLETCIHTILVWHVATTLCEPPPPVRPWWRAVCPGEQRLLKRKAYAEGAFYGTHQLVATQLSKYCAYLVAFAPELLPGNPYLTGTIFDDAVKDAGVRLGKFRTLRQRHERARALAGECREEEAAASGSVICLGSILANQLEMMEEGRKWKILADFWTELILLVAPSGQSWAHVKYLTSGGEFITHLWALLYHSGISNDSSNCLSEY